MEQRLEAWVQYVYIKKLTNDLLLDYCFSVDDHWTKVSEYLDSYRHGKATMYDEHLHSEGRKTIVNKTYHKG